MRSAIAALALLPASALATITITGPSATSFWVQNTSNIITWTFNTGDPSPADIVVVNSNNATLNGPFFIASVTDISNRTFTVTNVTLKVGSNYAVEFVNPSNASDVYATSNTFDVRAPGTAPAPTSSSPSSVPSSASATNTTSGTSPSSTSPSSSSGKAASSGAPTPTSNAAPRSFGTNSIFSVIAACGVAGLASILL